MNSLPKIKSMNLTVHPPSSMIRAKFHVVDTSLDNTTIAGIHTTALRRLVVFLGHPQVAA
jgi:hypothetical protein